MENIKSKKKKLNNKGLTLVEVIVAVAILSIAILPLLYTFIYTTKFNMKSKEKQRATSAAQAIVEKYKAYPLDSIQDDFSNNRFDVGKQGIDTSTTEFNVRSVSGTLDTQYIMKGVSFESNGTDAKSKYDALITVTRYSEPKYAGTFFGIEGNNRLNDAVYRVDEDHDRKYLEEAKLAIAREWADLSKDASEPSEFTNWDCMRFTRNIDFTIDKSGSAYKIYVKLSYQYSVPEYSAPGTYNVPYKDSTGAIKGFKVDAEIKEVDLGAEPTGTGEYLGNYVYDSSATVSSGATLKRFFIYYFPLYNDMGPDTYLFDNITVYNNADDGLDVYLYKQKKFSYTDADISFLENRNATRVKAQFRGSDVNLYQNLDTNLGTGQCILNELDLKANILSGHYDLKQLNTNLPEEPDPEDSESGLEIEVMEGEPEGAPEDTYVRSDLISKIEVKIYRAGAVNLDGETDENALITKISGSFNGKR